MSQSKPNSDWMHATRLVNAARRTFDVHRQRFRRLVQESNSRFHPLKDPLLTDFGINRWLSNSREEAWSDWLEWVVCNLKSPAAIFDLFGQPIPTALCSLSPVSISTQREVPVLTGHLDRRGRLDLVIRFGSAALLVVEVKVTGADADIGKHFGYHEWLQEQRVEASTAVVLAIDGSLSDYHGFHLVRWEDVCRKLRWYLQGSDIDDLIVRALLCGFVGAIEQRLLGFRSETMRDILNDRLVTFDTRVIDYLSSTIRRENDGTS